MIRKAVSGTLLTLLLTSMLTMAFNVELVEGSRLKTKIYVDPVVSVANPGEYFTINIKIADVVNLYGWGLQLKLPPPFILRCVSAEEGNFLKTGGSTFFVYKYWRGAPWEIYVDCTLLGVRPGVSGSGTLATVTFKVEEPGRCDLDLCETKLLVAPYPFIKAPHTVEDGFFYTTVPRPEFTVWPWYPVVNRTVLFDASAGFDPDGGAIVSYEWDFGDGTIAKTGRDYMTHIYEKAGRYDVSLTVTDNEGETYTFYLGNVALYGLPLHVWSIIKVPEDYSTIQEAIDASAQRAHAQGVILVASGTYHEHLVVNINDLILIGEDRETTIIDGDGTGAVITFRGWGGVHGGVISGFTVQNGDVGILLEGSEDCLIRDNTISNNQYGIFLDYYSEYNSIFSNTISNNLCGIYSIPPYDPYRWGNHIWLNNFINNIIQASTMYERVGNNYWSDYEGEDLDGDGIGDTNIPHFGDKSPLMSPWTWSLVPATVEIEPVALNLRNRAEELATYMELPGELTAYIEFPENYNVNDVVTSSLYFVSSWDGMSLKPHLTEVGDYDKDDIPDLMVEFSKCRFLLVLNELMPSSIRVYFSWGVSVRPRPPHLMYLYDVGMYNFLYRYDETGEVTLTIIGQLSNGKFFIGNDTIKITNLN